MRRPLWLRRQRGQPLPQHFLPIVAITFLLWLGSSILVPVLPLFGTSLGFSHSDIGLVVGAFFAGRLACNMAGGWLADRYTIRAVAILGCVITLVASLYLGFAGSLGALVAGRVVQGGGAGIYLTAAVAAIIAISPQDQVGKYVGTYQGIGLIGFSLGPTVGGTAAHFAGLRAPFFVYAAVMLVGVGVAWFALPRRSLAAASKVAADEPSDFRAFARAARSRPFLVVLAVATLVFWVRSGIRNNLVPLFADGHLQMSEVAIGTMLSVGAVCNVVTVGHAGRSLDRGRRPVIIWGTFATGLTTLAIGFLTEPWLLLIGSSLLSVATGYASVAPTVVTADVMAPAVRGRAVGVLRMATDLGLMVGPIMAGALSDRIGLQGAFVASGSAVIVLAAVTLLVPETGGASTHPATPAGVT